MDIAYTLTENAIAVFLDGRLHHIPRSGNVEQNFRQAIADGDVERLRKLIQPGEFLIEAFDGSGVKLVGGNIFYRGERIEGHLEKRLLEIVDAGLDVKPWKRFVERIYANPSEVSRDELALFFENGDLPITPDGCFLAYKRVNDNYTDCHTGQFDNSVGNTLEMPRSAVDDNRNRTCSYGFHFCSQDYLRNFLKGRGRIVVVKIDPADVVSIPSDYRNTKGRTCKYEVVGEVDVSAEEQAALWGVITYDYSDDWDDDDWDDDDWDDDDWDDDDWDEPEVKAVESVTTHFVAPSPESKSWWRGTLDRFRRS
jgi:hypothetical protein